MMRRFWRRVAEKGRVWSDPPVLVAALGDSVTQGWMETGCLDAESVYHTRLQRLLERRHPHTTFSTVNAGCGGETASGGLARLDRDVIRHQPDLVLVAYGLNDAVSAGLDGLQAFRETVEAIVDRVRTGGEADLLLVTPNMMLTRLHPGIEPRWRAAAPRMLAAQQGGVLAAYAEVLRGVARERATGLADVYAAWERLTRAGEDTTARLVNGLNHPDRGMHALAAETMFDALGGVALETGGAGG